MVFPTQSRSPGSSPKRRRNEASVDRTSDAEVEKLVIFCHRWKSPYKLQSLVKMEFLIRTHDRNLFRQCLSYDLTIERIAMMQRQIEQMQGMLGGVRQYTN